MEKALNKAKEGGYLTMWVKINKDGDPYYKIFCDPLFWQALGKSMGWGNITLDGAVWKQGRDGYLNVWQSYWHDFIDHLAAGKPAASFFDEFLKDNK